MSPSLAWMERNNRLDIQPDARGGFDMPIRRIKRIALGFMVFLGIVCAQGIAGPGAAAAADRVSLRLDWTPWSLHTFLFVAEEKGYFRSEDLEVRLYTPAKPQDTLKLVGVGKDPLRSELSKPIRSSGERRTSPWCRSRPSSSTP